MSGSLRPDRSTISAVEATASVRPPSWPIGNMRSGMGWSVIAGADCGKMLPVYLRRRRYWLPGRMSAWRLGTTAQNHAGQQPATITKRESDTSLNSAPSQLSHFFAIMVNNPLAKP